MRGSAVTIPSHRSDPRVRDRHVRRAALALMDTGPTCAATADRMGVRRETLSRWRNGHQPNVISRFLTYIELLAGAPDTSHYPLLVEAGVTGEAAMMRDLSTDNLTERYHAIVGELAAARTASDRAQRDADRGGDVMALERARMAEAALAQEHAAVIRLLRRDPNWRP
jgi:hypothetical protein